MAYNPQIYQPYGQMYGNYSQMNQPQYQQQSQQNLPSMGMIWVDGEVGAKAYQLPVNWPQNTPLPLWDTNDTVIYLKSTNQMGIPNPIQKIYYKLDNQKMSYEGSLRQPTSQRLVAGHIGDEPEPVDNDHGLEAFATKGDLEKMRQEIVKAIQDSQQTTNGAKKGMKANESSVQSTTRE